MIKLCIDNTSKLNEFHLYEPYLYGIAQDKNCFLVNNFSDDNSDIKDFNITIDTAYNILMDHVGETYEVVIITELTENDNDIIKKIYEIDEHISSKFKNNNIQTTKSISIIVLDYTGNGYMNLREEKYALESESNEFFSVNELRTCQNEFFVHKDRDKFIKSIKELKSKKSLTDNNKWYFYILDKMMPHFLDSKVVSYNKTDNEDFAETFREIMSYYVKQEFIDNKLIVRCDMSSNFNYKNSVEKSFYDMNKFVALLSIISEYSIIHSKKIMQKGIYNANIGLDDDRLKSMIMQYSENLKEQLQYLICNKKNSIKVEKRTIPNISLRNIFLEPVKVKKERLSFFRSSRDVQYLDRIEKNITNLINKKIQRVRKNNIQNICDLRTLRFFDDSGAEMENLNMIELEAKIQEKKRFYEQNLVKTYKNKVDYYGILEEFLKVQQECKEKILFMMNRKLSLKKFALLNGLLLIFTYALLFMTYPEFISNITNKEMLFLTFLIIMGLNIVVTIGNSIFDNFKINQNIDEYVEAVNSYNERLQISSNEEINKLTKAYELILINGDIEYYSKKYSELFNTINMHEFHIAQIEKHINIAKRLCERIGVEFDEILIANDSKYDEIVKDVEVEKDVCDNECYNIMNFLLPTKDYTMMLNGGEFIEKIELRTYIKSINFTEDEVYRF